MSTSFTARLVIPHDFLWYSGWEWPEDYMAIDEQELELPVPEEVAPAPIIPWQELQQKVNQMKRNEEFGYGAISDYSPEREAQRQKKVREEDRIRCEAELLNDEPPSRRTHVQKGKQD
ncbi:unnamed protein product [Fusarium equiseti]|uniref:Uncharacterized protein n=1 Tax=Fusarium equiseti TaxID=61235 RepID=A0A8J2NCP0_FUSEQ|nr:unnamed protein product [Fusarium equiseti]